MEFSKGRLVDLKVLRVGTVDETKKALNVKSFNMSQRKKTFKGLINYLTNVQGLLKNSKIVYIDETYVSII